MPIYNEDRLAKQYTIISFKSYTLLCYIEYVLHMYCCVNTCVPLQPLKLARILALRIILFYTYIDTLYNTSPIHALVTECHKGKVMKVFED